LASGFTAIELLLVLFVLSLGAAIGVVAFRRSVVCARVSEATSMLSEIASREQAFYAGGGRYLALRADGYLDPPSPDESAAAFYPQPADSPALASARTPTRIDEDAERWPEAWRRIGLRPGRSALYCTYMANAGEPGQPFAPDSLRFGTALLGAGPTTTPWFYALAACNFEGGASYPDGVTVFGVSSRGGPVQVFNEGR
jgi:prepilin-type N-terminal cleavage/methylation domain-containing protein